MDEIFIAIRKKSKFRKIAGLSMVSLGLVLYLVPLIPGSWAVVIGLEVLGVRLLVETKLKERMKSSKLFKRVK